MLRSNAVTRTFQYYWSSIGFIYAASTGIGMNMLGEIKSIGKSGNYFVWLVRGVSRMNAVIIPMF